MRIVFVNLHCNWMLVKNSAVLLLKNSAATKHSYLLSYLLNNPEIEVCSYINERGFSLVSNGPKSLVNFLNHFSVLEHKFVMRKNGIPLKKVTVIKNISEIRKDDIVLTYNMMPNTYLGLDRVNAFKVASMIHYGGGLEQYNRIRKAGIDYLMCEVNLSKSSELFRKYSKLDLPWILSPFVFAERFKNYRPFENRKNKAFSVGTITYKTEADFLDTYGDSCDHPIRKYVKDHQDYYRNTIDCYSQDYLEDQKSKEIKPGENKLAVIYKKFYNRTHLGKQKKYFSFDMVAKFNEYKMHIVGEEILGVPGIGFVEGMACGSAYVGIDSSMYRDLGLIPGTHYITYDGTPEGLKNTIEYYQRQENQLELERIAKNGCEFVRKHFCGDEVSKFIFEQLLMSWNIFLNR